MSEEMLVCHCSPTLAGLKTGSLFSCPYSSQKMIIKEIREFNQKLTQKGIRIIPVRISDKRMLVYVYRPEKLKEDFSDEKNLLLTFMDDRHKPASVCLSSRKVKRRFF